MISSKSVSLVSISESRIFSFQGKITARAEVDSMPGFNLGIENLFFSSCHFWDTSDFKQERFNLGIENLFFSRFVNLEARLPWLQGFNLGIENLFFSRLLEVLGEGTMEAGFNLGIENLFFSRRSSPQKRYLNMFVSISESRIFSFQVSESTDWTGA